MSLIVSIQACVLSQRDDSCSFPGVAVQCLQFFPAARGLGVSSINRNLRVLDQLESKHTSAVGEQKALCSFQVSFLPVYIASLGCLRLSANFV